MRAENKLFFRISCSNPHECSKICVESGRICEFLRVEAIVGEVIVLKKGETMLIGKLRSAVHAEFSDPGIREMAVFADKAENFSGYITNSGDYRKSGRRSGQLFTRDMNLERLGGRRELIENLYCSVKNTFGEDVAGRRCLFKNLFPRLSHVLVCTFFEILKSLLGRQRPLRRF